MSGTVYRQIVHRLRINRGPGRPDKVIERPRAGRKGDWREYLDDDNPTLIEFDEFDQIDLDALLRQGAIVPHALAAAPARPARGVRRGETASE